MSAKIYTIGVVGGGTMGRGIVQLFAQAGHTVRCFDAVPGAADKAIGYVGEMLGRSVSKGKITTAHFEAIAQRMSACQILGDLAGCDVIVEAIVEDLGCKIELFRALEDLIAPETILASNTSSLLVSAIASGCRNPGRVAGLHFFNPVPLMKVAEVIPGVRTNESTVTVLTALITQAGHRAVIAADQPGFLVNHAGRGLYTEGLRIIEESVASPADVDRVLRSAVGFRMGPFELLDLTGLDVSGKVMQSIYEQFQQEPRFRPSSLVPPRIAAGLFGRKTGHGWYVYPESQSAVVMERNVPTVPNALRVWVDPEASDRVGILALLGRLPVVPVAFAKDADLILVQCWGQDATSHCAANHLDARRCVAIDPLPGLARHRTLMLTATTQADARDAASAICDSDGVGFTVINDSCGFIVQRVLATIVNIACDIAQRRIASIPDIEDSVTLGLGYPFGPLSWGDQIGPARVLQILSTLSSSTADPRYRPSPWLRRRATLGVSLLSAEPMR
jgi:3-hydroxybutyryl-CoA dehydrogenase